jgi:hypothetical protein
MVNAAASGMAVDAKPLADALREQSASLYTAG